MKKLNDVFIPFLQAINQISGIQGGIVVDNKGSLLASYFQERPETEKLTRLALETAKLVYKFSREGRVGRARTIYFTGTFGSIFILPLESKKIYTAIYGSDTMNIGLIRAMHEETISKLFQ